MEEAGLLAVDEKMFRYSEKGNEGGKSGKHTLDEGNNNM